MGNYATTTSLQTTMIGTSFDTATTSLANKCISWSEDEVNKYLSKRYDLSGFSASTPPLVQSLTEQIASGYMFRFMARGSADMLSRAKEIIDPCIKNLEGLSKGKFNLFDTSGAVIADASLSCFQVFCNTDTYHSTFDEDDPLNWKIDTNKIDDIEDAKD